MKRRSRRWNPERFLGDGVCLKAKLIGDREVEGPRGDAMCAEAMRASKAAVKAAGTHKQRILLFISVSGMKIIDEKTKVSIVCYKSNFQDLVHDFPVARISFVARDTTDGRAFGFVFGTEKTFRFYGIKTAQSADNAVYAIRQVFELAWDAKKKQHEEAQLQHAEDNAANDSGLPDKESTVPVADLLDLETELKSLAMGIEQLQNIATLPDDCELWPGENESPPQVDAFTQSFLVPPPSLQTNPFVGNAMIPPDWGVSPIYQLNDSTTFICKQFDESDGKEWSWRPLEPTNPFASTFSAAAPEWPCLPAERLASPPDQSVSFHVNTQTKSWQPGDPRLAVSVEEGFNKLVDLDSLTRPEARKNPFDEMLNPPKPPLNALARPMTAVCSPKPARVVHNNDVFDIFAM